MVFSIFDDLEKNIIVEIGQFNGDAKLEESFISRELNL